MHTPICVKGDKIMLNAFVCGLCTACAIHSFIDGNIDIGIANAAFAILNGVAMFSIAFFNN